MIHPVPKPKPKRGAKAAKQRAKRERVYGPAGFGDWIRAQPCIACHHLGHSVQAHIGKKGKGTSRKADWDQVVALCASRIVAGKSVEGCHEKAHRGAIVLDVPSLLRQTQQAWRER